MSTFSSCLRRYHQVDRRRTTCPILLQAALLKVIICFQLHVCELNLLKLRLVYALVRVLRDVGNLAVVNGVLRGR